MVHLGIEKHKIKFALTGSSARKLRRGAANLLGGRAIDFSDTQDKKRYLYSYISTYLKEEILIEQIVINEFIRLNEYQEKRCRFSYLKTKDDVEIDLIIERPGQPITLIEIKSKSTITANDVKPLLAIAKDIKKSRCYVLSTMQTESEIDGVRCLPWGKGLKEILK